MFNFTKITARTLKGLGKHVSEECSKIEAGGYQVVSVTTVYKLGFGKNWKAIIYFKGR